MRSSICSGLQTWTTFQLRISITDENSLCGKQLPSINNLDELASSLNLDRLKFNFGKFLEVVQNPSFVL